MLQNDPTILFGKRCVITLKEGGNLVRIVDDIDTEGVHVHDDAGAPDTIPFDCIRQVRPQTR